jgi:uncharacterized protein (TIGR03663 family)
MSHDARRPADTDDTDAADGCAGETTDGSTEPDPATSGVEDGDADAAADARDSPGSGAGAGASATAGEYLSRVVDSRRRDDRTFQAVVGIAVVALLARSVRLGARIAHWDEGRVAFWTLRYAETGYFEYRAIVHGPFLFQVDRWLFAVLGPSDFAARLPVAVVGGLLPLAAWGLRDRLRDAEVVALALFLAANPLLLYYSRFMRNDVLVAGFCTLAFVAFVRAYDSRRARYVYAGATLLALGFTAKENALLYVACWLGAAALLLDHRLLGAVRGDETDAAVDGDRVRSTLRSPGDWVPVAVLLLAAPPVVDRVGYGFEGALLVAVGAVGYALSVAGLLRYVAVVPLGGVVVVAAGGLAPAPAVAVWYALGWLLAALLVIDAWLFRRAETRVPPALGAYLLFFAVVVFFYAPRAGPTSELGLWRALGDPRLLPALLEEAVVGSWQEFRGVWAPGDPFSPERLSKYPDRMENMAGTMRTTAGALTAFAAVGLLVDRYTGEGPRDVVAFAGYWGIVSVLGYPYATDIWAPWIAVHAVVPLALPAAVGLAGVYSVGARAWTAPRTAGTPAGAEPAPDGGPSPDADGASGGADDERFVERLGPYARVVTVVVALVLVVTAVPVAVTAVDLAYLGGDDDERVLSSSESENQYALQWAQPETDLKRSLETVGRASERNRGTDVLFVGSETPSGDPVFFMPAEEVCQRLPPVDEPRDRCEDPDRGSWHSRLPLPWYLEAHGSTVDSTPPDADLLTRDSFPPVVIAYAWDRNRVQTALPADYEASTHRFKLWDESVVVFVDPSVVDADPASGADTVPD